MTRVSFHRSAPAVLALALFAAPACAVDVRPAFKAGIDVGGDTLIAVPVSGSSLGDTKTIKTGEGLYIGGGASILSDPKDLELEVMLSYKFAGITAQNGDIRWSVLPLDVLVFYRMPNLRFGGGLTYHINPTLKGSGIAGGLSADYKDGFGFVVQGDYMFGDKIKLGLRYVNVIYKVDNIQNNGTIQVTSLPPATAKTNAVGIVFTVSF
jgi:outer membrane protein with beta-barrel domain